MMLVEETPDIPTSSGPMDCFTARPVGEGRFPLVVLFMDVWGLREELFGITRRVAREGYFCVLPNLFHRHGKLRFSYRTPDGKAMSFSALPTDVRENMRSYAHQTTSSAIRDDVGAILAASESWPVRDGPAGSVGFCMGGRAAFYAGQEFPDRFRANASLHGTLLVSDKPFSAHRGVPAMRGEIYCGFGERDEEGAPKIRAALKELFDANGAVTYRSRVHPGAHHGYSMPDRDIHDESATEADWSEIFAMFKRQLG